MAAAEPEETFKVTDRRRRGGDESPPSQPRSGPGSLPHPPPTRPPETAAELERSLVELFMMLGASALVALGEIDPATGQRGEPDLALAARLVDILITLREKTDGRRSSEESQVLDELLYDLQLRYVNATTRPG